MVPAPLCPGHHDPQESSGNRERPGRPHRDLGGFQKLAVGGGGVQPPGMKDRAGERRWSGLGLLGGVWLGLVLGLLAACRDPAPSPVNEDRRDAAVTEDGWRDLSGSWEGVEGGEVREDAGVLRLGFGEPMTAARWQGEVPEPPFEIEAEARRIEGADFFFGLTFPGRTPGEAASLIVGGWGGGVVGISSIDGFDASENPSTSYRTFENGRWHAIRLRVTADKIEGWVDGERLIDVEIGESELSLRPGPIEACLPFGLATWESMAEVRGMRWRKAEGGPDGES